MYIYAYIYILYSIIHKIYIIYIYIIIYNVYIYIYSGSCFEIQPCGCKKQSLIRGSPKLGSILLLSVLKSFI